MMGDRVYLRIHIATWVVQEVLQLEPTIATMYMCICVYICRYVDMYRYVDMHLCIYASAASMYLGI